MMDILDSDKGLMKAGSLTALRDIVQFVELRKFVSQDGRWSKERLADHVLFEVPKQLTGWMQMRVIKPLRA
jgi:hypothetical protein